VGSDPEALACRQWVVRGRVHGVGFRWFVLNSAQALGIRGWVANTRDGDVEVVGLASLQTLAEFEVTLERGPPSARVTGITSQDVPHDTVDSKSFTIKH
jgi:acylphosphatase